MARNPYRQGGLATAPPELDDDPPARPAPAAVDGDGQDQGDGGNVGDDSAGDASPPRRSGGAGPGRAVDGGAGWVLGLILWGGVVLPFLKGGPDGVKAWWLAKFFNKAPDGSELP